MVRAGAESEYREQELIYADYATPGTLTCAPRGWHERASKVILPEGLTLHCLDPHDVAYNKLYAGRPKDIVWVRGLLKTGLITWARLEEMHAGNPLDAADREKVDRSIAQVRSEA